MFWGFAKIIFVGQLEGDPKNTMILIQEKTKQNQFHLGKGNLVSVAAQCIVA